MAPPPESDTMKELILLQAIINSFNATPKWDLAAKALHLTPNAVGGRYRRIKKKIDEAGLLYPLHMVGPDGKPVKRGRGRPPKIRNPLSAKVVAVNSGPDEDDEEDLDSKENNKNGKTGLKRKHVEDDDDTEGEEEDDEEEEDEENEAEDEDKDLKIKSEADNIKEEPDLATITKGLVKLEAE